MAIAAISALTRRGPFWIVSLLFGVAGSVFLVFGAITKERIVETERPHCRLRKVLFARTVVLPNYLAQQQLRVFG
jgi:hypothetical protein